MPDRMPEAMPDRMLEDMRERMPDRMPEDMPHRLAESVPEDMQDKTSERSLPVEWTRAYGQRMADDKSDRMSTSQTKKRNGLLADLSVTR